MAVWDCLAVKLKRTNELKKVFQTKISKPERKFLEMKTATEVKGLFKKFVGNAMKLANAS